MPLRLLLVIYFNSIKVRLELDYFLGVLPTPQLFQFHKGAIRTCPKYCTNDQKPNFNSIKVRLEHGEFCTGGSLSAISIP